MVEIDGNQLSLEQIEAVARQNKAVTLAEKARERMLESQHWVEQIIADGRPVYGINTGFGIFADRSISPVDLAKLSRNLNIKPRSFYRGGIIYRKRPGCHADPGEYPRRRLFGGQTAPG